MVRINWDGCSLPYGHMEGGSVVDIEWSCPTCTYINRAGSFKCSVCGTPKGTATRQVKFHLSALEQQYVAESLQSSRIQSGRLLNKLQTHSNSSPPSSSTTVTSTMPRDEALLPSNFLDTKLNNSTGIIKKRQKNRVTTSRSKVAQASKWPRLRNIDRSRIIRSEDITINNVTVNITEYPLLYPDSDE